MGESGRTGLRGEGRTMSEARRAERVETGGAVPRPLTPFARVALCGGGVGLTASAVVTPLAGVMPWAVANALVTAVSTLLCTELHALFTFVTGQRAGWRRHLQSAGSATAAYAMTSAAVLVLRVVEPT